MALRLDQSEAESRFEAKLIVESRIISNVVVRRHADMTSLSGIAIALGRTLVMRSASS